MIDKFDYAEPQCPLCSGEDFYYPKKDAPKGRIPVDRIISKVDGLFAVNNYTEAGRVLEYWKEEAKALEDMRGLLAIESELIGYYRKQNDKEKALLSVKSALLLTDQTEQGNMASGATVFINCATAYKAFGMPNEALKLYLQAEEIYKRCLPISDARFGGLYNNMALALAELGSFDDAERSYFSALDVMKNISGGEAESAITYINLAHMYENCGRTEKINSCMKKAYELLHSESLTHDGYYAFVLEKCAPSFGYFGDASAYNELKKEYERIYAGN